MDARTDELVRDFVAEGGKPEDWWLSWHGSYSIAPTDDAPVVRDRGDGFDPDSVPGDRHGVRDSIVARMERHGGTAKVRILDQGTEVALTLPVHRPVNEPLNRPVNEPLNQPVNQQTLPLKEAHDA